MERLKNESNTSTRRLGEEFLDYIRQAKRSQNDYLEDSRQWQRDLIGAIHQDGGAHLVQVSSDSQQQVSQRDRESQQRRLESLDVSERTDSHARIVEAYERTFHWIYRDDKQRQSAWMSLVDWLQGDYLDWITRKAGSGKSSLMKYIFNDSRTLRLLEAWASGVPLIAAAFFH
ncbi:hypothetical protein N7G274_002063 [Stereocaulon virgatum]|uniref:Uncharacterized protein n=1 Tax=Stereocaulon virgatum TaxID=373712 RepID=A0ABR4AIP6_9LECA